MLQDIEMFLHKKKTLIWYKTHNSWFKLMVVIVKSNLSNFEKKCGEIHKDCHVFMQYLYTEPPPKKPP